MCSRFTTRHVETPLSSSPTSRTCACTAARGPAEHFLPGALRHERAAGRKVPQKQTRSSRDAIFTRPPDVCRAPAAVMRPARAALRLRLFGFSARPGRRARAARDAPPPPGPPAARSRRAMAAGVCASSTLDPRGVEAERADLPGHRRERVCCPAPARGGQGATLARRRRSDDGVVAKRERQHAVGAERRRRHRRPGAVPRRRRQAGVQLERVQVVQVHARLPAPGRPEDAVTGEPLAVRAAHACETAGPPASAARAGRDARLRVSSVSSRSASRFSSLRLAFSSATAARLGFGRCALSVSITSQESNRSRARRRSRRRRRAAGRRARTTNARSRLRFRRGLLLAQRPALVRVRVRFRALVAPQLEQTERVRVARGDERACDGSRRVRKMGGQRATFLRSFLRSATKTFSKTNRKKTRFFGRGLPRGGRRRPQIDP